MDYSSDNCEKKRKLSELIRIQNGSRKRKCTIKTKSNVEVEQKTHDPMTM